MVFLAEFFPVLDVRRDIGRMFKLLNIAVHRVQNLIEFSGHVSILPNFTLQFQAFFEDKFPVRCSPTLPVFFEHLIPKPLS